MKMTKLGLGCLFGALAIGAIFVVSGENTSAMQYHHYQNQPQPKKAKMRAMHGIGGQVHAQTHCHIGKYNEVDCELKLEGVTVEK